MNTDGIIFPEVNGCSDEESPNNADGSSCSPIGTFRQSTVCRSNHKVSHIVSGSSFLKRMSVFSTRFLLRSSVLMSLLGAGDCRKLYNNLCIQLCSNLCALIRVVDGMQERGVGEKGDLVGKYLNETVSGIDLEQLTCGGDNKGKVKELVSSLKTETSRLANEASKLGYKRSYADMYEVLSADKTVSGEKVNMCSNGGKFCNNIVKYVSYNNQKHQTTTTTTATTTTTDAVTTGSGATSSAFTTDVTAGDETLLPFTTVATTSDTTSPALTTDIAPDGETSLPFTTGVTIGDTTSPALTTDVAPDDEASLPFTTGVTIGDTTSLVLTTDVAPDDETSLPFTTTSDTNNKVHLTTRFYDIDQSGGGDGNTLVFVMGVLFLIGIIAVMIAVTRKGRRLCGRKRRGVGTTSASNIIYLRRLGSDLAVTEV
ncbi:hypothetical protein [Candidatus Ichthyocystis sparus]|nr:hypothetical protein [Candidatus Ichthyocystis sparus]